MKTRNFHFVWRTLHELYTAAEEKFSTVLHFVIIYLFYIQYNLNLVCVI